MLSERKLFWAFWFWRSCLFLGTLGCLVATYLRTFVNPDIIRACAFAITALLSAVFFFSTFPAYRLETRFNHFKKRLPERTDFEDASLSEAASKNEVRRFTECSTVSVMMLVLVTLNVLGAGQAYSHDDYPRMFWHMVVIVAALLLFNASLLMHAVDETFRKILRELKGRAGRGGEYGGN